MRLILVPALLASVMTTALVYLHFADVNRLESANRVIRVQGRATQDLAQGLLHFSLGSEEEGGWQRARGLQLLRQAADEYLQAVAVLPEASDLRAEFSRELDTFDRLLQAETASARDARRDVDIRLALGRLQGTAEQVDLQLRSRQIQMAASQDRVYRWSVAFALLLFGVMAGLAWRSLKHRQRLERERLSVLMLLESVTKSSTDLIFAKDREGRYLLFSDAGEQIIGVKSFDVIGKTDEEAFKGDRHIAKARSTDEQVLGGVGQVRYQFTRPAHFEVKTVDVVKSPLFDESGVITGVLGVARDITRMRQQELALADSRAQLAAIIDALEVGLVVSAPNGELLHINPAAMKLLGNDPTDPRPRTLVELRQMHQLETLDGKPVAADHFTGDRLLRGADTWNEELILRRKDLVGSRTLSFHGVARRDLDGSLRFLLLTFEDITQRRQSENINRQTQRLEALGTLAAGIAHDFNNLLLAISGHAALARADMAGGVSPQESLEQIEHAGKRAADLVRRILLFARAEQGQRQAADLRLVLEQTLKLFRPSLPENVRLNAEVTQDQEFLVDMDASQIHQALLNLLTNAAHAVEDKPEGMRGNITALLSVVVLGEKTSIGGQVLPAGRYALLSIQDNGVGMPPDVLEHIFDPFFTTKPVGKGTGLGMPMVHGILREHAGTIDVKSRAGEGTDVDLYLPLLQDGSPTAKERLLQPQPASGNGRRILFVDDEAALVRLMERGLGRLGYVVTGMTDPAEAIRELEADPSRFDLVVTDLSMPGWNGFDVLRAVRASAAGMRVILMSGYVRQEDREIAHSLGVDDILLKPNSVDDLAAAIARLLR
jgi:PAS domain S-box-containing protein